MLIVADFCCPSKVPYRDSGFSDYQTSVNDWRAPQLMLNQKRLGFLRKECQTAT